MDFSTTIWHTWGCCWWVWLSPHASSLRPSADSEASRWAAVVGAAAAETPCACECWGLVSRCTPPRQAPPWPPGSPPMSCVRRSPLITHTFSRKWGLSRTQWNRPLWSSLCGVYVCVCACVCVCVCVCVNNKRQVPLYLAYSWMRGKYW